MLVAKIVFTLKFGTLKFMCKKFLFIILSLSMFSCEIKPEKDFADVTETFIKEYAQLFPDETPLSKSNENLSKMHIPTDKMMDSVKAFYALSIAQIQNFKESEMTPSVKKDFLKVKSILKNVDVYLRKYHTDPTVYNVLFSFDRVLNSDFTTPENRLQILFAKLENVPAFYAAAKSQLQSSDVKLADEAIEKHFQTYLFFDKTLPDFIKKNYHITPQYQARLEAAKLAIKDYIAYVQSFRLM